MSIRTQHRILRDPKPGQVVRLPAGSRLEVRFRRRGLGLSRWQVEDRPAHLVPLVEGDHGFSFLVFQGQDDRPQPLRLVWLHGRQSRSPLTHHRQRLTALSPHRCN